MKDRSNNKAWDDLIEKIIFSYEKWWKQESKEKMQNLLFRVLKTKYEVENNDTEIIKIRTCIYITKA